MRSGARAAPDRSITAAMVGGRAVDPKYRYITLPRSVDDDTGLPTTEDGFGVGVNGCNGVVHGEAMVGACNRNAHNECKCPTGGKCKTCCGDAWAMAARDAADCEETRPEWACARHKVPSKAIGCANGVHITSPTSQPLRASTARKRALFARKNPPPSLRWLA
jgi:hypothetical protein